MRIDLPGVVLSGLTLVSIANGQAAPSQPSATRSTDEAASVGALAPSNEMRNETQPIEKSGSAASLDAAGVSADLPPLPRAKATLIGGTIEKLDRVRDELTVRPFGGGRIKILFDPRTRIYCDGKITSAAGLKAGDRVSVETILEGTAVFARSIRLNTDTPAGESQGAVISYRADRGELWLRDALSPNPVRVRLTSSTRILAGKRPVSASELVPGTLVTVKFFSEKDGVDVAREVTVLALPGARFTFAGRVVAVNIHTGRLVLASVADGKNYEIYFEPSAVSADDEVRQGADVIVLTRFDGTRYMVQNMTVAAPSKP